MCRWTPPRHRPAWRRMAGVPSALPLAFARNTQGEDDNDHRDAHLYAAAWHTGRGREAIWRGSAEPREALEACRVLAHRRWSVEPDHPRLGVRQLRTARRGASRRVERGRLAAADPRIRCGTTE